MGRLLKDSEGREVLLGDGIDLRGKVLYVEGVPLFKLHDPVAPDVLDVIASLSARPDFTLGWSDADPD